MYICMYYIIFAIFHQVFASTFTPLQSIFVLFCFCLRLTDRIVQTLNDRKVIQKLFVFAICHVCIIGNNGCWLLIIHNDFRNLSNSTFINQYRWCGIVLRIADIWMKWTSKWFSLELCSTMIGCSVFSYDFNNHPTKNNCTLSFLSFYSLRSYRIPSLKSHSPLTVHIVLNLHTHTYIRS